MKKIALVLLLALGGYTPPSPGVVFELETTDHEQSPPRVTRSHMEVEEQNIKLTIASGDQGSNGDMVFRGDRRELVVVDHNRKSYMVIDEETMRQIAGQFGQAMQGMDDILKNLPEEQRKAIEEARKNGMNIPGMPGQTPEQEKEEVRKTSERDTKEGYPCVKYEVYRGDQKIREFWVTDWDNIDGGDEAEEAIQGLMEFMRSLQDAGDFPGMDENPFSQWDEIDGFPVVTRNFEDDGSLDSESALKSARRQRLDPDAFEPPSGYKRMSMGPR